MNRPLVSYVIVTHNRAAELREALESVARQSFAPSEIVVVDNGSTDATLEVVSAFALSRSDVVYRRLDRNVGPSVGRNLAFESAKGQILINLDDDSTLIGDDAPRLIVERFSRDPSIGVLAFKVIAPSGDMRPKEFPTFDRSLDPDQEFDTTYFCGAGAALRRDVFEEVGGYLPQFFIGLEELELSLRILDAGYRIVYFPQVVVIHKKTTLARLPMAEFVTRELQNRFEMNVRHLPWHYVASQQIIRVGHAFILLRGNPLPLVRNAWWCIRNLPRLTKVRRRLRPETLVRIRRAHGRLLY